MLIMKGLEVKKIRKDLGYSQEKFAELVGVHPRTVQNWESGAEVPKSKHAILRSLGDLTDKEEAKRQDIVQPARKKGIPFYSDMDVSAGKLNTLYGKEEPAGYIDLPGIKAEALFPVVGYSMQPEINPGDIIGVVAMNSWEIIDPDKIYMIITDEDRMIKHIEMDTDNKNIVWCVSPNYNRFKLNKSDIRAIYRVTFCAKLM